MLKSRSLTPSARARFNPLSETVPRPSVLQEERQSSGNIKQFLYFVKPSPLLAVKLPSLGTEKVGNYTPKRDGFSSNRGKTPRSKDQFAPAPKRVFRAVWTKVDSENAHPEVREGAAMAECCGTLYLYGGLNNSVLCDLHCLRDVSGEWQAVATEGMDLEARYGHTMVESSTKMIAFGGSTTSSLRSQIRDCLNTVRLLEPSFSTQPLTTSFLSCRGMSVDMRRYHSACLVGRHMVVNGGMNQKNKVLDDCSVLDLETAKWTTSKLVNDPAAIACHTAALVFEPHLRLSGVYDPVFTESSAKLKARGVYLFGGINNKGEPNNQLRLIQPIKKYLVCTLLEPTGRVPEPRYQHSMTLLKHINVLVVFGGKTGLPGQNVSVLSDVHVLDLESLNWAEVVVVGQVPEARCAHCVGSLQEKLVLFGGINLTSFCTSETHWLEVIPHSTSKNQRTVFDYRLLGSNTRSSSAIRRTTAKFNQTQFFASPRNLEDGGRK